MSPPQRQAMDFFQAQDSARSRSRTLVLLFIAAVIGIIATIYAVVHVALGPGPAGPIDPMLLIAVAVGTTLLVVAGSTVRTMQLRQGGSKVAEMLGGRRVRPNTSDEAERRLVNIVEEMAIASGTPVPAIYVLDNEAGINAFAAGYTLDDAAVAVTRGTLEQLNREELQGVIAHEFSHILNGDMRLNIRLIGLLFGILLLAIIGRGILYSARGGRGRRDGGAGQIALVGLALVAVGYIGVFFGKLIQSAVSRQREYLADAAAVQFTRNPEGIAGALKKIGAVGSRVENHHAQEASHMFFATGLRSSMAGMMATHPPLVERIRRLEPAFDGRFPEPVARPPRVGGAGDPRLAGVAGLAGTGAPGDLDLAPIGASPVQSSGAAMMASIGAPQPEHVAYAGRLLRSLPEGVRGAAHDPDGSVALLFALLLHDHGPAGARQRDVIESHGGEPLWRQVTDLARGVAPLGAAARLPLLDLLLPALRELTPLQAGQARATAEAMIAADGRTDMFELALLHVLGRQLESEQHGRVGGSSRSVVHSLAPLRNEVETVLSAVAWSGAHDERRAGQALASAAATLPDSVSTLSLRPRAGVTIPAIDEALQRLHDAAPGVRRRFLEACVAVVAHDGLVDVEEAELLRAVAEALECPMPPLLAVGAR